MRDGYVPQGVTWLTADLLLYSLYREAHPHVGASAATLFVVADVSADAADNDDAVSSPPHRRLRTGSGMATRSGAAPGSTLPAGGVVAVFSLRDEHGAPLAIHAGGVQALGDLVWTVSDFTLYGFPRTAILDEARAFPRRNASVGTEVAEARPWRCPLGNVSTSTAERLGFPTAHGVRSETFTMTYPSSPPAHTTVVGPRRTPWTAAHPPTATERHTAPGHEAVRFFVQTLSCLAARRAGLRGVRCGPRRRQVFRPRPPDQGGSDQGGSDQGGSDQGGPDRGSSNHVGSNPGSNHAPQQPFFALSRAGPGDSTLSSSGTGVLEWRPEQSLALPGGATPGVRLADTDAARCRAAARTLTCFASRRIFERQRLRERGIRLPVRCEAGGTRR